MATAVTDRSVITAQFSAMGTQAEIQVVDGDPSVVTRARARLEDLEARWSRFRPTSEIAALNRRAGSTVPVSPETLLLLERGCAGAQATEGRYDPTTGGALIAHGYDRTFPAVRAHAAGCVPFAVVDGSYPAIEVDRTTGTAGLPDGTTFDPGGIGKGLAADIITDELGPLVGGILVNIGGDLAVRGTAPDPAGWVISVEDPLHDGRELARLALPHGGLATSSQERRRWTTATGPAHHIIDPATGRPAVSEVSSVSVVAAAAWWAEVQATSLFLLGPAGLATTDDTVEALMVLRDGSRHATAGIQAVIS